VLIAKHIGAPTAATTYDYSRYERFSYHGFWGNYGFAYQPWWSR